MEKRTFGSLPVYNAKYMDIKKLSPESKQTLDDGFNSEFDIELNDEYVVLGGTYEERCAVTGNHTKSKEAPISIKTALEYIDSDSICIYIFDDCVIAMGIVESKNIALYGSVIENLDPNEALDKIPASAIIDLRYRDVTPKLSIRKVAQKIASNYEYEEFREVDPSAVEKWLLTMYDYYDEFEIGAVDELTAKASNLGWPFLKKEFNN